MLVLLLLLVLLLVLLLLSLQIRRAWCHCYYTLLLPRAPASRGPQCVCALQHSSCLGVC